MNELALFAGAGGGLLGGKLLGWRTVCAVEWDPYARDVLVARQNDGSLPPFPIWDDVQTFDGHPWRGRVDVVSGGFPCQDISAAGKGAGIAGARSGMWQHMARIIGEVLPRFAFVENSPLLVGRGLARVLADLAALGYDARWGIVGAHHAGAPHKRDRIWIVADRYRSRQLQPQGGEQKQRGRACDSGATLADTHDCDGDWRSRSVQVGRKWSKSKAENHDKRKRNEWCPEPDVGRVAHGVAARVDRLRCLGNGQVPAVVPLAWRTLTSLPHP
jgi:DNA (cytosine-5)-methyltransferase 1